jgi:serine/threonine-protein kinase
MGLLNRFKTMLDSSGGRLDVEARYEFLRDSVSGTMSQFRMARDRRTDEIVGLKILDDEKTKYFEARFKGLKKPMEGEIASRFDHPRIVKTYGYGQTKAGHHFVLMEFLPGKGLNSLIIAQDSVLDGKRFNLILQMAEAVGEVHSQGFIHRDVCPRNFIVEDDASSLKLIDFGLTVPATRDFMQPGNRTGTPQYMAPEIARRRWTDQRVDIFSLGVSFYQLIAFELPWPSSDMTGKVAMLHDTKAPIDLLSIKPNLNPALAKTIHQCIAGRPEARPDDIPALLRQLHQIKTDI